MNKINNKVKMDRRQKCQLATFVLFFFVESLSVYSMSNYGNGKEARDEIKGNLAEFSGEDELIREKDGWGIPT